MTTIRSYFIAILLMALFGGMGLSLVTKITAERLEDRLLVVTRSAETETSFAAIKVQLDVLLTISDLVFGGDVSYLRDIVHTQIDSLDESLKTFGFNHQDQTNYAEIQLFSDELKGLKHLLSDDIKSAESLRAYEENVTSLISTYEGSSRALKVQHDLSESALEQVKTSNNVIILSNIIFYVLVSMLIFVWAMRRISVPITTLASIETAVDIDSSELLHDRWLPVELKELTQHLLRLLGNLEAKVSERTQTLKLRTEELESQAIVLVEAKKTAEKADAAKSLFLGNMSHELRTPLNAVIGISDLLVEQDLDEEQIELVRVINRSGHDLLDIITNILNFSQLEQGGFTQKVVAVDLRGHLAECVSLSCSALKRSNVHVQLDIAESVPNSIAIDPDGLTKILVNLLSNALKFNEDGPITLRCVLKGSGGAERLSISIEDEGIGLSEEHSKTIFEPFEQVDSTISKGSQGTGLGLSIAKRTSEEMGGSLTVVSEFGVGSTFTLEIPFERTELIKGKDLTDSSTKSLPSVLIVDDNNVNVILLKHILEMKGFSPSVAFNGKEAVDQASIKGFDIILMDLQMPVMDGYEAIRLIRENMEITQPKIVVVTAFIADENREMAIAAGANAFINKPINQGELFHALSS
jgi:signal transduction histidine kinase/ActR/RegA family two-component response regulator